MSDMQSRPQPTELDTGERLSTTGGAVAQGVRHTTKGEHETAGGAELLVHPAEAEKIIAGWPPPQKKVAEQMLARYGPPDEATPTKLLWYHNAPWKRTEITSDVVVHHWPAPHSDF